jgi:hypothetical protein
VEKRALCIFGGERVVKWQHYQGETPNAKTGTTGMARGSERAAACHAATGKTAFADNANSLCSLIDTLGETYHNAEV